MQFGWCTRNERDEKLPQMQCKRDSSAMKQNDQKEKTQSPAQ
jgi:hypothetical protein